MSELGNGPFLVVLKQDADGYMLAVEWLLEFGAASLFDGAWVLQKYDGMAGDITEAIKSVAPNLPAIVFLAPPDSGDRGVTSAAAPILRSLGLHVETLRLVRS